MALDFWDDEWYPFIVYGRNATLPTNPTRLKVVRGNSKPTFVVVGDSRPTFTVRGNSRPLFQVRCEKINGVKMSSGSPFVGDPYQLIVQYHEDLTDAQAIEIRLQKPNGSAFYVTGTQYQGSRITANISTSVNDTAGTWIVQGVVNYGDGRVHGEGFEVTVKPLGTMPFSPGV